MTKDEFISKESDWKRYRDKIGYLWGGGFGLFILWPFLFSDKRDLHGTSPLWQVCFVIYFLGGVVMVFWLNIRRMRQLGMFCPRCKWGHYFLMNPIVRRRILATGKCRCGQEIIESHDAA